MSPARYRAELAALAQEFCDDDRCGCAYPVAEMARCAWCDGIFCSSHFHAELGCCWSPDCLYQAANRLRELRDAAITVLNATNPLTWQWNLRTALEILRGKEKA